MHSRRDANQRSFISIWERAHRNFFWERGAKETPASPQTSGAFQEGFVKFKALKPQWSRSTARLQSERHICDTYTHIHHNLWHCDTFYLWSPIGCWRLGFKQSYNPFHELDPRPNDIFHFPWSLLAPNVTNTTSIHLVQISHRCADVLTVLCWNGTQPAASDKKAKTKHTHIWYCGERTFLHGKYQRACRQYTHILTHTLLFTSKVFFSDAKIAATFNACLPGNFLNVKAVPFC